MGAAVITLREGFEASLVVGIVLAFLARVERAEAYRVVWAGAAAAVAVSVVVGAGLFAVGAELEGRAEAAFEGAVMLAAAGLLTWMIFWMRRQARSLRPELEAKVEAALAAGSSLALGLVVFVAVVREGIETALFLIGSVASPASAVGGLLGLAGSVALGVLFFKGAARLDLRRFFTVTSVLLLLFAAWLLANGLHELEEASLLPESEPLLVAAFVGLAGPALALYLRRPSAA
jgi:high-affinity iron transporter